ncbi:integral membrane protein [Kutzneria sp. 744]|nr:integral membrane protein [Kutzneria sp. 744]
MIMLRIGRLVGYAVVLGFVGYQLWSTRDDLLGNIDRTGPGRCALTVVLALAGSFAGMLGWRVLLAGLGTRLPAVTASRVYFVAGLGKYLPGGLWPALAHADLARRLREPPGRLAAAFLGSVALSTVAGLIVGLIAVPSLAQDNGLWWLLVPLLALCLVPVLAPRLLTSLVGFGYRLLRRTGEPPALPSRGIVVRAAAWMALGWLITGVHFAVLVSAFATVDRASASVAVSAFVLASVAGIVAFVLPAGLGARELILGLSIGFALNKSAVITVVALRHDAHS